MRQRPQQERPRFAPPRGRTPEEQRLIASLVRTANGEEQGLKELYALTSAKLCGFLCRMCGNEAEAEEILQEVYLSVWKKAFSYDDALASPMTWLFVIARNKAIDRLRKHPRQANVDLEEAALFLEDPAPSALEAIARKETHSRLKDCLEGLDTPVRDYIRAAFFNGLTYKSLARGASVPLPTMKSWIRRGLLRLRECLDK